MKTFFTADTHFGHANIIRYSARPFCKPTDFTGDGNDGYWVNKNVARQRANEMDEGIISIWNSIVSDDDIVYHLGDFCFGHSSFVIRLLRRLKGKIKFIWGNHDEPMKAYKTIAHLYPDLVGKIEFLGGQAEISINGQEITLNHYAMRVWNKSHHGSWQLYGHSHGSLPDDPHSRSFDVGMDCHGFKPLTFEQVKAIMDKKIFQPIDHHGKHQEGGGIGLTKEDYAKADRKRKYLQLKQEFELKPDKNLN